MQQVIRWGNYVAKALVPWAVLAAVWLADLAAQWTAVAEDGTVDVVEWQTLLLAAITSAGVFLKRNGERPA